MKASIFFFDGGCDDELIEIGKVYQNLPDKIAGLYVDYVIKSLGHCNIADFKTWISKQILFFEGVLKDLD